MCFEPSEEEIDAYERELAAEKEHAEAVNKAAAEWDQKWPDHCKSCNGWGGSVFYENHGLPGVGEAMFDECGAIEDLTICHRCGKHGLNEDGEGPCSECGWNYDDGKPQF